MSRETRRQQKAEEEQHKVGRIRFVTWIGFWVNIVLSILKITAGYLGNSRSVMADGVHSLSDLVTDIAVLVGVRFWQAPPDREHPYGHKRLESLVALGIGLLLALAGLGIAVDAAERMAVVGHEPVGSFFALGAVLLSLVSKELLFRWTHREGEALNSAALKANAWHHRSDAFSSLPIALAVGVALWFPSFAIVDLLGALVVACFILYAAWKICRPAVNVLLDKGVSNDLQNSISDYASRLPGVKGIHSLRTRYLGEAICLDLHVCLDASLTLAEADSIAHALENMLLSPEAEMALGIEICDVLVHVDPWDPNGGKHC